MHSAGVLPYRLSPGPEVLVAHPGGPLWARRDLGAWSIVKGLVEDGEDSRAAAAREFTEETGWDLPDGVWLELGEIRLRSGKRVTGWGIEADYEPSALQPGEMSMHHRGRLQTFPEIDRVAWFDLAEARRRLNPAYGPMLDRLERQLRERG